MKKHLSILAILFSVAAASAQAQDSTATYLESNVRYSQNQMIVLLKSCAPHAALSPLRYQRQQTSKNRQQYWTQQPSNRACQTTELKT
jgi:hypothetical protein